MKVVIIAGGTPPSFNILRDEMLEGSVLICADSGADCLVEYNMTCDYLVGDFDSIRPKALEYLYNSKCIIEKHPVEKDDTDTQLALLKAVQLRAKTIAFLGCSGSRLDHTFGNLGLLMQCTNLGIHAYIRDEKNTIWIADKSIEVSGTPHEYFSLLAYGTDVENLTVQGAKYNLSSYNLKLGSNLGISNKFIKNKISISFDKGILMITKSID
jgi:thiamine pyrophosphokinase